MIFVSIYLNIQAAPSPFQLTGVKDLYMLNIRDKTPLNYLYRIDFSAPKNPVGEISAYLFHLVVPFSIWKCRTRSSNIYIFYAHL